MRHAARQDVGATLQTTGKPGFRRVELLVNHRLGPYCTYIHDPRTVKPAIFFDVCKTVLSVVLREAIKGAFAGAFHSVSRVRTQVHNY